MATLTSTFRINALPAAELERIRRAGEDDFGNPVEPRTVGDDDAGSPLRCCLRRARPGERMALIAYRPAGGAGAYAEVGPVFIHAETCAGYQEVSRYPEEYRGRQQVLRAYDERGRIAGAVLTDGAGAERVIDSLLARPDVVMLQSRNVLYGCYMFSVTRLRHSRHA
jgi:hypothetical protein